MVKYLGGLGVGRRRRWLIRMRFDIAYSGLSSLPRFQVLSTSARDFYWMHYGEGMTCLLAPFSVDLGKLDSQLSQIRDLLSLEAIKIGLECS